MYASSMLACTVAVTIETKDLCSHHENQGSVVRYWLSSRNLAMKCDCGRKGNIFMIGHHPSKLLVLQSIRCCGGSYCRPFQQHRSAEVLQRPQQMHGGIVPDLPSNGPKNQIDITFQRQITNSLSIFLYMYIPTWWKRLITPIEVSST
jgi:hypothetical protein